MENTWIPDTIKTGLTAKQAEFLCYEGREALFGGAAGGGKSIALLCAALQWIDDPGYNALILRRTYKQLARADSILNKSKEWLAATDARWNGDDHKWTFPNGNTLEFGHMEYADSIYNYQGGSWAFVGVDEATQFTEQMLAYPRTRQRRPAGSKIPIRWRGASNPGGIGHDYIKARYVKDKNGKSPCGPDRQFFPATIEDNPNIDRDDYICQLNDSGIDPITLAQLLRGDWDAVAGGRFQKSWFHYYRRVGDYLALRRPDEGNDRIFKPKEAPRFITVDPAASEKRTADYTVISVWCLSPWNELIWLDCIRVQKQIPDIIPEIQRVYDRYRPMWAAIEQVAANAAVYQLAARTRMIVRPLSPGGRDKLVRSTPAIVLASTGRLWLPSDHPTFPLDDVESELIRFTGVDGEDAHDDIVDTLSYAAECFAGMEHKPSGQPKVHSTW